MVRLEFSPCIGLPLLFRHRILIQARITQGGEDYGAEQFRTVVHRSLRTSAGTVPHAPLQTATEAIGHKASVPTVAAHAFMISMFFMVAPNLRSPTTLCVSLLTLRNFVLAPRRGEGVAMGKLYLPSSSQIGYNNSKQREEDNSND